MNHRRGPKEYLEKLRKTEDMHVVDKSPEDIRRVYGDGPDAQYLIDLMKEGGDMSYPQRLFEEITSTLPAEDRLRVQNEVAFGELLLRDVNATLREAKEGYHGYVIIVNRGLTSMFYFCTKALLARTASSESYLERAYNLRLSPLADYEVVSNLILDALRRYHRGEAAEPPFTQRRFLLDEPRRKLLSLLHASSVSFVISHELGHFLCGHMGQARSIEGEFEADAAAMSVLLNRAHKVGDDRAIAGAIGGSLLALIYIELMEKTGKVGYRSHPPADKRIDRIRETFVLNSVYFELADPLVETVKDIANRFRS